MTIENKFEMAVRSKVRFNTTKGLVTTEDLWDMPVEQLDEMYRLLMKANKDNQEESLLKKSTTKNTELTLKIDIIEYVVKTKLAEAEAKENAAIRKTKSEQIKELIAKKKNEEMGEKSVDELMAMLDELN